MTEFKHEKGIFCLSCGQETLYSDTEKSADLYLGDATCCRRCGCGGHTNQRLEMTENQLAEILESKTNG
jgi:predicted nucleic-acid-binding Zn-ribbon protein